jgi:hypothetical protein
LTTTPISSSGGIFTAVQSGAFNASTTWINGQIPSGQCSIIIQPGVIVTFTGEILAINVQTLTIAGSFVITSSAGGGGFTFQFPINIIVQAGGAFYDQTNLNQFYFLAGSVCTFYSGAFFIGSNTQFFQYTSLPASGSLGASYTIGSSISSSFTFAILLDGTIQTFNQVTFIAAISGSFTSTSVWIGGIVPTDSICSSVGGCGLYISSGCVLSTISLNGVLNINFNLIVVATGANFELGSAGVVGSFRFRFASRFDIHGTLTYIPLNFNGIYLPIGSAVNFYAGAIFNTTFSITINIYNPSTNVTIGSGISISTSFSGPYYASISLTGVVVTSTIRK